MSTETETKKRVRLGCFVKPEVFDAVKRIKEVTNAKSEGAVLDAAIEAYDESLKQS